MIDRLITYSGENVKIKEQLTSSSEIDNIIKEHMAGEPCKTIEKLTDLKIGEEVQIACIKTKSHGRMQKLMSFGLIPGRRIILIQNSPMYCISSGQTEIAIEKEISEEIYVWKIL
jgi:ferrous iron transport protein A